MKRFIIATALALASVSAHAAFVDYDTNTWRNDAPYSWAAIGRFFRENEITRLEHMRDNLKDVVSNIEKGDFSDPTRQKAYAEGMKNVNALDEQIRSKKNDLYSHPPAVKPEWRAG